MTTGIKLKLLREKRKLSQEELAFKVGVVQATIGNWERGKSIKHEHLEKVAIALKVTPSYFFEGLREIESESNFISNNRSDFEITIKAPNTLFDDLNKKMDFIINRFNGIL